MSLFVGVECEGYLRGGVGEGRVKDMGGWVSEVLRVVNGWVGDRRKRVKGSEVWIKGREGEVGFGVFVGNVGMNGRIVF